MSRSKLWSPGKDQGQVVTGDPDSGDGLIHDRLSFPGCCQGPVTTACTNVWASKNQHNKHSLNSISLEAALDCTEGI